MHSHRRTHLQYTHCTRSLIVTDRAERAAFSHHDESLARKKKKWRAERQTESADKGEERLRESDKQKDKQGL